MNPTNQPTNNVATIMNKLAQENDANAIEFLNFFRKTPTTQPEQLQQSQQAPIPPKPKESKDLKTVMPEQQKIVKSLTIPLGFDGYLPLPPQKVQKSTEMKQPKQIAPSVTTPLGITGIALVSQSSNKPKVKKPRRPNPTVVKHVMEAKIDAPSGFSFVTPPDSQGWISDRTPPVESSTLFTSLEFKTFNTNVMFEGKESCISPKTIFCRSKHAGTTFKIQPTQDIQISLMIDKKSGYHCGIIERPDDNTTNWKLDDIKIEGCHYITDDTEIRLKHLPIVNFPCPSGKPIEFVFRTGGMSIQALCRFRMEVLVLGTQEVFSFIFATQFFIAQSPKCVRMNHGEKDRRKREIELVDSTDITKSEKESKKPKQCDVGDEWDQISPNHYELKDEDEPIAVKRE